MYYQYAIMCVVVKLGCGQCYEHIGVLDIAITLLVHVVRNSLAK